MLGGSVHTIRNLIVVHVVVIRLFVYQSKNLIISQVESRFIRWISKQNYRFDLKKLAHRQVNDEKKCTGSFEWCYNSEIELYFTSIAYICCPNSKAICECTEKPSMANCWCD